MDLCLFWHNNKQPETFCSVYEEARLLMSGTILLQTASFKLSEQAYMLAHVWKEIAVNCNALVLLEMHQYQIF